MEGREFRNFLNILKNNILINKNYIDKAIYEDYSKKMPLNFEKIYSYIEKYEKNNSFKNENINIAAIYNGLPEVTIELVLDAIIHNNRITFFITNHKELNSVFLDCIINALAEAQLANKWIDYEIDYNEIYLKDNVGMFKKIIFIGDYYEYKRLEELINAKVEYYNYGNIKLYIDMIEYGDEFRKINDFCYKNGIALEIYDDIEDFIKEIKDEDNGIIYADMDVMNQINRLKRVEDIKFNTFPYDEYTFELRR